MEYEMADGSQFSLRDVWTEPDGHYLSVTAFVDGKTYAGKLEKESADTVDDVEIAESLQLVPPSCIHPRFPPNFQRAPPFNLAEHFLKGPSFVADDCQPGTTVVAENLLREASIFERLQTHPHPNIVPYYGCVLEDIRITHLCLKRCVCNLLEYAGKGELLSEADKYALEDGIEAGIRHLHSLGLAHNDINPTNICIDLDQKPVIIDFDSCLPFGEDMIKGPGLEAIRSGERPKSDPQNDWRGLEGVVDFLWRDTHELNLVDLRTNLLVEAMLLRNRANQHAEDETRSNSGPTTKTTSCSLVATLFLGTCINMIRGLHCDYKPVLLNRYRKGYSRPRHRPPCVKHFLITNRQYMFGEPGAHSRERVVWDRWCYDLLANDPLSHHLLV
nr:serine/threonine-protein kinase ppk4 [Quercus suber]